MCKRTWFGSGAMIIGLALMLATPVSAFGFAGLWGSGYWEKTAPTNGVTATTRTHWSVRGMSTGSDVPQIHITGVEGIWTSASRWVRSATMTAHTVNPNAPAVSWPGYSKSASVSTGSSYNTFSVFESYSGPWCNYMGGGISTILSGKSDAVLTSGAHAVVSAGMGYGRWVIDGPRKGDSVHAASGAARVYVVSARNWHHYYDDAFRVDAIGGTWDFAGDYGTSKCATLDHVVLELRYGGINADTGKYVKTPSNNLSWTVLAKHMKKSTVSSGKVTRYECKFQVPSRMAPALLDTSGANSSLQLWTDAYYRDSKGHIVKKPLGTTVILSAAAPM